MLISGGAGRAGRRARRSSAPTPSCAATSTPGFGFDAITVALLGRGTPMGTVLAGLLFGAFRAGSVVMGTQTHHAVRRRLGHRAGGRAVHRRPGAGPRHLPAARLARRRRHASSRRDGTDDRRCRTPPRGAEDDLVVSHEVVEVADRSPRRGSSQGIGLVVAGVVTFLAWGLGAKNGDAAFQLSQFRRQVARAGDLRYPGGAVAMVMGVGHGRARRRCTSSRGFSRRGAQVGRRRHRAAVRPGLPVAGRPPATRRNPISLTGLVGQSIIASIPLVLGALAGIVCERSGVINIAIEGQMLVGAFAGALFASSSGSLGIGIVAACLGGALIGALLAVFAIRYLVNQVVLGVVLNSFALGLTEPRLPLADAVEPEPLQRRADPQPDQDPAAGRHPGARAGAVRRQHHRLHHLRAGRRRARRAVPHPLGAAHPRGRRAPEGRRHRRASRCCASATATC